MSASGEAASARAARLMDMLGLSDDELCRVLDEDPLSLLSGQVEHRPELAILIELCEEAAQQVGEGVLRRWVRANGAKGRPIDALLARDFATFEDAIDDLRNRGFVLRGNHG